MRGNIVINYLASGPAGIENFTSRAIVNDGILTWVNATVKSPANPLRLHGSPQWGVLNLRARVAGFYLYTWCSWFFSTNMETSKVPLRGKVKDAEAEALLKLLRQEKEYNDRLSAPQIHQRIPLPAIGSRASDNKSQQCKETDPTFITETLESSRFNSNVEDEKELLSDSNFLWTTPKTDVNNNVRTPFKEDIYVPPYSWKGQQGVSCTNFNRQRKKSNGRTLPPLEIPSSPSSDLLERPSCPYSSSSKFWDDWRCYGTHRSYSRELSLSAVV